jgi:HPt (histidine-containing phosphotransfer) domain-containing protein
MNDHVTKPIDPDALFAALARWVKPRGEAAVAASNEPKAMQVTTAEPAPADAIPDIEGIDVSGGLKRVAGNKRLYRNLLEQFVTKQGGAGALISEALRNGDRELAGRLAHTAKGVAGNLGIGSVQAAAEGVERAIRESVPVEGLLEMFESVLDPMVQAIQRRLAETAPGAGPVSHLNPVAAAIAIARLRALIEANDGGAADAFSAVESAVGGAVDKTTMDGLRNAIADFDFDRAVSRLVEIDRQCALVKA